MAITFHPDKFTDTEQREEAQARFNLLKDAYDVLIDDNMRAVYDDFGAEAVKKQRSMQVGRPTQSTGDFLREMFRMRRKQHHAYIMRRVDHTGNFAVLVNVMNSLGQARPEMGTMSVRQSIKFPMSATSNVRLSFSALLNGSVGQGSVKMSYERSFIAAAAAGYASLRMSWNNWALRFGISKQLFDRTHGDMNFGFEDGTGRLRLKIVRGLSERWNGSLETTLSKAMPGVKLSIATRPDNAHWSFETGLEASAVSVGLNTRGSYEWSERTTVSLEAGVSNNAVLLNEKARTSHVRLATSWYVGGTVERTISQLTKAHVGFTLAPHGVFVNTGFSRLGQTFSVPVLLSHVPSIASALTAITAPLVLAFFLEAILLEPRRRRKRLEQEHRRRRQQEAQVAAAKERAQADCRLMSEEVQRKREFEENKEKGGLIVLQAFYGRHPASAISNDDLGADLEEIEDNERIDVTMPLQCLVQNSQIVIAAGSTKSGLIGFYDPIPDEDKWLEVIYLYNHKTHHVLVADLDSVRMPLKSHLMD